MSVTTIAAIVVAVISVLGLAGTGVAWLYKRGRTEQSLSDSVDRQAEATNRNTAATELLAGQVGGLRDTLEEHGNLLVEHHWRLNALENQKMKVTVERSS